MAQQREWDPSDVATSWALAPGLGRCIGVGSAIGVVLAFAGVAVPSLLYGIEWRSAIGLGAFTAFWGGLGFGSMMGGVAYMARLATIFHAGACLAREKPS